MSLIVQKYGGSSVGSVERIENVAKRIKAKQEQGNQVVAVISAMGGVTDSLLGLAGEISKQPSQRELDVLLATGEQQSIALLTMALHEIGVEAVSCTGRQAGVLTTGTHTAGKVQSIDAQFVLDNIAQGRVVIVAGFQGVKEDGSIHTLGRGGSDLSAIAMAHAVGADKCEILTDVDGVYTCDPRVVPQAQKIQDISYDEMFEMASSGSKVMQARSVEFAKKHNVIFEVRSSLNQNSGTLVTQETPAMEAVVIRGVSIERAQARITITGLPDIPGTSAKVFSALSGAEVNVDMIVSNNTHEGLTRHSLTIPQSQYLQAKQALEPVLSAISAEAQLESEEGIGKLSIVGVGMKSHHGVAAQMFEALGKENINIGMISTSEIKITITVAEADLEKAAKTVHTAFGLDA